MFIDYIINSLYYLSFENLYYTECIVKYCIVFVNGIKDIIYAISQAARQGLAVLMASTVVVLKHETSTIRQRHNFISIDLTFGVSDYVREVSSPDKVGLGPMSGRDDTCGQHIRVLFFFSIFFNRATAHTREPIFARNSSKDAVWCKEDPFWDEKCVILKFGGVLP